MDLILEHFPDLTKKQLEQLAALKPLYEKWNARINVISRKDIPHLYEKHVLHSLTIAKIAPFPEGTKVLDIGTGGGFPGIPLAIMFPNVKFYLVDSIGKKIKVVNAVSETLGLKNVQTEHNRAEKIKHPPFDFVVTRAVASLKKLCCWSLPHLKKRIENGITPTLFCLKGGDLSAEIAESGQQPKMYDLYEYVKSEYLLEKYLMAIENKKL